MFLAFQNRLLKILGNTIEEALGVRPEKIVFEIPPDANLGDLACPVSFDLARSLRRAPRDIASDIAKAIGRPDGIDRVEVAGAGYINFFFDRSAYLFGMLSSLGGQAESTGSQGKILVEHTNINPNKAAHIGHLRNAALGDTFVRILRYLGRHVEVQNYIDDTGVQVADVVVGFQRIEDKGLADVESIDGRFDYICWDLYSRVSAAIDEDPSLAQCRTDTLHAIEAGEGDAAEIGRCIAGRIVRCHLKTMARLGVSYDLLAWEGDIIRLRFWEHAFNLLKESGSIVLAETGPNTGCWVMALVAGEPAAADDEPKEPGADEKVIVRSNGTVTYVGKDIAYQLWKFGLLGRDFGYTRFDDDACGRGLWTTTSGDGDLEAPHFGSADTVYNVIDTRQSYLQGIVTRALEVLGHELEAANSIHFDYEMVALSPRCLQALGYTLSEAEAAKPHVEVSGRKGLGIKADDLIDTLEERATAEVSRRNPDFSEEERERMGRMIARAALRYFMVKYTRNKVIAFDLDEALNFEGESGPYLQYAVVRANNIFRKLEAVEPFSAEAIVGKLRAADLAGLAEEGEGKDLWEIIVLCSRLRETADQSIRSEEPAILAKFCLGLAQQFNAFYHKYKVIQEEDETRRALRIAACHLFRTRLAEGLGLLGIEIPARM